MIIQEDITINRLSSVYNELTLGYSHRKDEVVVFSHYGVFSKDLVNSIAYSIEELMNHSGERKTVVKRMFSILIEGLQNIRLHSLSDANQLALGFVIVSKSNDFYKVSFGNIIKKINKAKIIRNIDGINHLDNQSLKMHYRQVLSNGMFSDKGGAGLGLITMKMKSDTKIIHDFIDIGNSLLCFTFSLKLKR